MQLSDPLAKQEAAAPSAASHPGAEPHGGEGSGWWDAAGASCALQRRSWKRFCGSTQRKLAWPQGWAGSGIPGTPSTGCSSESRSDEVFCQAGAKADSDSRILRHGVMPEGLRMLVHGAAAASPAGGLMKILMY